MVLAVLGVRSWFLIFFCYFVPVIILFYTYSLMLAWDAFFGASNIYSCIYMNPGSEKSSMICAEPTLGLITINRDTPPLVMFLQSGFAARLLDGYESNKKTEYVVQRIQTTSHLPLDCSIRQKGFSNFQKFKTI